MTEILNPFKPSEVVLGIPPLAGTLKHSESEAAAAMLVRAMQVRGDTWAPVAPREMGKVLNDDLDGNVEPLASLNRNPFFRPNFEQLADDGFARWIGDRLASAIEFTPAGIEALRRWVRPPVAAVQP